MVDLNQRRPQKNYKKNIQTPISRVKFPAEHVPGFTKCKAISGNRGKPVERNFFSKNL